MTPTIRATNSCRGNIAAVYNYIEDSGADGAISLNCAGLEEGGNTIAWTGTTNANPAVFLDKTSSVGYKFPDQITGYTSHLKIDDTVTDYVEPIYYGETLTHAVGKAQAVRTSAVGTLLVGAATDFEVGSGTTDGFSAEQGGQVRASRDDATAMSLRRRTSNGNILSFYRDTTSVGSISVTTTNTAYNTSSDRRLKENITTFSGSGAILDALQVRAYTWKANSAAAVGFIADELSAIVPEAVTGEANAVDENGQPVYQGVDYSKLVPYLVAEIKSLRTRVAQLEA